MAKTQLTAKAKAEWYARILCAVVKWEDFKEATDNLLVAVGPCYNKEGETEEELWEAVCEAHEAEFARLKVDINDPICTFLLRN